MKLSNGETDRRLNDDRVQSFDSSVRVWVGRRLRRTGPQTGDSFAIGRAHSDQSTTYYTAILLHSAQYLSVVLYFHLFASNHLNFA